MESARSIRLGYIGSSVPSHGFCSYFANLTLERLHRHSYYWLYIQIRNWVFEALSWMDSSSVTIHYHELTGWTRLET